MQVLVTGSQGRIGSVIVEQLQSAGHRVVEYDKVLGNDMLDGAAVRTAAQNCDAIIHLASLLGRKTDDPDETMAVGSARDVACADGGEGSRVQTCGQL